MCLFFLPFRSKQNPRKASMVPTRLQEPGVFFVHKLHVSGETCLVITRLLHPFSMRNLQVVVVPRKELLIALEEFRDKYLQVSHQGYSALTWCHEHEPQEPQKWLQERDTERSAPTQVHHTCCAPRQLGTTANQRYDVHRDWLWDACQLEGNV